MQSQSMSRGEASRKCHRGLHVYAMGSSVSVTVDDYRIYQILSGSCDPNANGQLRPGA
jgi:hypothetical protein